MISAIFLRLKKLIRLASSPMKSGLPSSVKVRSFKVIATN